MNTLINKSNIFRFLQCFVVFNIITFIIGLVISSSIDITNDIARRQLGKIENDVYRLETSSNIEPKEFKEKINNLINEIELLSLSLKHARAEALGSGIAYIVINNFFLLVFFMLCFSIRIVKPRQEESELLGCSKKTEN